MKFYDREQEIEKLQEIARRSREVAQFTVVTGRRRVGKSSLILKAYEKESFAYLFVERKSEKDLCEGFDKEYGFYFSVLSAIACGRNTRAEKIQTFQSSNVVNPIRFALCRVAKLLV